MQDESLTYVKTSSDIDVEIEVSPKYEIEEFKKVDTNYTVVNQRLADMAIEINELDEKIARLENNADMLDYIVATGCGIITGILDIIFVDGLFKNGVLDENLANNTILKTANASGIKLNNLNELQGICNNQMIDDHPSLLGLVSSVITNVTGSSLVSVGNTLRWVKSAVMPSNNIYTNVFNAITRFGIKTCGGNIPGVKQAMSSFSKDNPFSNLNAKDSAKLNNLIDNGFKKDVPFDISNEVKHYVRLGKQALVVGINEVVVRAFYFVRRFFMEVKKNKIKSLRGLKKLDFSKIAPFKNRTIVRMLTISMSTMCAIDIADAAIESLVKSAGNQALFVKGFFLKVNYVGLGRMIIAISTDIKMGSNYKKYKKERALLVDEYLQLNNSKIYYKQKDMWEKALEAQKATQEALENIEKTEKLKDEAIKETKGDIENINNNLNKLKNNNPKLISDIKNILQW